MTTTTTYRLDLPWPRPPLVANGGHGNRYGRAAVVREIRNAVKVLAQKAHIPKAEHLTVCLYYAPGDNRRRDEDNLWPTLKAACDALARGSRRVTHRSTPWIGLELVADDTRQYMTKLTPVIVPPPEPGPRCWLTVEITPKIGGES